MFKGLGAMGDMAKLMKNAQEMQGKVVQMQEEMHNIMVVGEAGAGLVKATCTAKGDLKGLDIDPSIFSKDDKEVVEDLIVSRFYCGLCGTYRCCRSTRRCRCNRSIRLRVCYCSCTDT
ncbi:MAG: YbaB/EbfC family nucleoid-associated protein [Rhodobacteraceae bacterium]|nr:YbaB/EbfC family nucleoid-associated protein [Paracoccaceae bacterium]